MAERTRRALLFGPTSVDRELEARQREFDANLGESQRGNNMEFLMGLFNAMAGVARDRARFDIDSRSLDIQEDNSNNTLISNALANRRGPSDTHRAAVANALSRRSVSAPPPPAPRYLQLPGSQARGGDSWDRALDIAEQVWRAEGSSPYQSPQRMALDIMGQTGGGGYVGARQSQRGFSDGPLTSDERQAQNMYQGQQNAKDLSERRDILEAELAAAGEATRGQGASAYERLMRFLRR